MTGIQVTEAQLFERIGRLFVEVQARAEQQLADKAMAESNYAAYEALSVKYYNLKDQFDVLIREQQEEAPELPIELRPQRDGS